MMININQSIKPKDVKEKDNQKNLEIPQFTTGLNGILLNFDKKKPKGNGVQRDKGKIKPIFSIIDITKDKEDIFNLKESIPTQIVFREKEK